MKNKAITLVLIIVFFHGFSQSSKFQIHGNRENAFKKDKLAEVKSLKDIIPYYPESWIYSYETVEVSTIHNGKIITASGAKDSITQEQKDILNLCDLGAEVKITVRFKHLNKLTGNPEPDKLHFKACIIPATEAEYPGGKEQMAKYLQQNAIDKISEADKKIKQIRLSFTVNENGEVMNPKIAMPSPDPKIDQLFLDVINQMPKWKAAEDASGAKVKEEFQFTIGSPPGSGGC